MLRQESRRSLMVPTGPRRGGEPVKQCSADKPAQSPQLRCAREAGALLTYGPSHEVLAAEGRWGPPTTYAGLGRRAKRPRTRVSRRSCRLRRYVYRFLASPNMVGSRPLRGGGWHSPVQPGSPGAVGYAVGIGREMGAPRASSKYGLNALAPRERRNGRGQD